MNIAETVSIKSVSASRPDKELDPPSSFTEYTSHEFEIMANVIWAEIGRTLIDELGGVIFAFGRPNEFKKVSSEGTLFQHSLILKTFSIMSFLKRSSGPWNTLLLRCIL